MPGRAAVDGVICGHIHVAAIYERGGIVYINCGDWVESCTAIVEHLDGRMELVRWTAPMQGAPPVPAAPERLEVSVLSK